MDHEGSKPTPAVANSAETPQTKDVRTTIVAIKADRNDERLLVYYVTPWGRFGRVKPSDSIKGLQDEVDGIIATEKYLKGDHSYEPDPRFKNERDPFGYCYFDDFNPDEESEEKEGFIQNRLHGDREMLLERIHFLEQLELQFEAGILHKEDAVLQKIVPVR